MIYGKYIKIVMAVFLLFLIIIWPTSCLASVYFSKLQDSQIATILKTKKIGLLDFFQLPPNYPPTYKPLEFSSSKELYASEISKVRIFVPRNSTSMIVELLMLALSEKGVSIEHYANIEEAFTAGAEIVIAGAIKECKVSAEAPDADSLKAEISVHLIVFNAIKGDKILREGDIKEVAFLKPEKEAVNGNTDFQLIMSNFFKKDSDIFTISEEECFHPLRVLLSVAIHNSLKQVIEKLDQSLNERNH